MSLLQSHDKETATRRLPYPSIRQQESFEKCWLGPFATASRLTPIHQVSLAVLSRAACASMSTTTTTTTTTTMTTTTTKRDRGDRYGPMEWAQSLATSGSAHSTGSCTVGGCRYQRRWCWLTISCPGTTVATHPPTEL